MVDFIFKRLFFRIREMAFISVNEITKKKCDVVYLHSCDEEILEKNTSFAQMQYTLVNDLTLPFEEILSKINKNYRYEIRRAEKEGAQNLIYDKNSERIVQIVEEFEKTYNCMFSVKGMNKRFNRNLFMEGVNEGQIIITVCTIENYPNEKVFHAYLMDGTTCVLMYSASPIWEVNDKEKTNCIGRMNKFLHCKDMEYFKSLGYVKYEWGGIGNPDKPGGIDRFKSEFGGELKCFCNYFIPNSVLGYLYVALVKVRMKK